MKWKIQLINSGSRFWVEVYAANYDAAKRTALAQNPTSTFVYGQISR
jgi:hypothetical protein